MLGGAEPFEQLGSGIMGNICVKLFQIWTSGSGDVCYICYRSWVGKTH